MDYFFYVIVQIYHLSSLTMFDMSVKFGEKHIMVFASNNVNSSDVHCSLKLSKISTAGWSTESLSSMNARKIIFEQILGKRNKVVSCH